MKERLVELMRMLNCTPTQFANAIGVQRATIQHIINGRNEPSLKIIMAIHENFPNIDLEWLMYGKGNAFGDSQHSSDDKQDYPLFQGMESAIFHPEIQEKTGFSNLKEEKPLPQNRKRSNNKGVSTCIDPLQNSTSNRIKEIVVFFEDGTYQKFSTELKK